MDAADPQGSPPDRDGDGSCSPPPSGRDGGSSSTPPAAGSRPELIEVDDNVAVLVITPAFVYDMKEREVYYCPRTSSKPSMTSRCRTATGGRVAASGRVCTR